MQSIDFQPCKMIKTALFVLAVVAAASAASDASFSFRGKPYVIVSNEKVSWVDAIVLCASRKMELASIDDDAEQTYVKNQLIARGLQNTPVWIGGTEIGSEDNYVWVNSGLPVELPYWDETEVVAIPNRCMVMLKGLWRHGLCSTPNLFICESATPVTTVAPTTSTTPLAGRR